MTSKKKNPPATDQNYQLNMEILSSLKSIPGKVVNLQSENFINEELNKKFQYPEGKKTTSSSISKVSKDFFCDQLEEKNTNKKLITTNSVFKPMMNLPPKKSTMNFYPFNTVMSFPDLCIQNPIGNAPPKITNSSFSRNSFCVMNPNLDPNLSLLNQMNTLTQINQINQINQYNFFSSNPFNSFGTLNALNTPTIPLNDIYLNKNNNSNNIKNIFLGQKRNSDEKTEEKEKEKIFNNKKNIFFQINSQKKESNLNLNNSTNNIINTNSQETTNKRNLFTVKSVFIKCLVFFIPSS